MADGHLRFPNPEQLVPDVCSHTSTVQPVRCTLHSYGDVGSLLERLVPRPVGIAPKVRATP